MNRTITVTQTFMPEIEVYQRLLRQTWGSGLVTKKGLLQELDTQLKKFLRVSNLVLLANGTSTLQVAIKAFDLKGEIIQTPIVIGYHQRQPLRVCPDGGGLVNGTNFHRNPNKDGENEAPMTVRFIMDKLTSLMRSRWRSSACDLKWEIAQRLAGQAPTHLNHTLVLKRR